MWVFTLPGWEGHFNDLADEEFDVRLFTDQVTAQSAFEGERIGGALPHIVLVEGTFGPLQDSVGLIKKLMERQSYIIKPSERSKFLLRSPHMGSDSEKKAREAKIPTIPFSATGMVLKRKMREIL